MVENLEANIEQSFLTILTIDRGIIKIKGKRVPKEQMDRLAISLYNEAKKVDEEYWPMRIPPSKIIVYRN